MPTSAGTVFLTGGTGFVGSHVLRALVQNGYSVRALVRGNALSSDGSYECVPGDLRSPGTFARALDGCRFVVHCAALYSFAPHNRSVLREVNVRGTRGLLEAARIAGVERVVVTSSSATVGPSADGRPRCEDDLAEEGPDGYHHSKLEQERAAFAARVPVIALLPTAPVGPGDWKPTPTGKLIVDFANGKMPAKPPRGGLNVVPVEDVAHAHVAALRSGRTGERYILGGENLLLDELWEILASVTGKPVPRVRAPYSLALALAHADRLRSVVTKSEPFIPVEGVRMSRELMFADSSKARRELNFSPGSARAALERSVQWYADNGYLA